MKKNYLIVVLFVLVLFWVVPAYAETKLTIGAIDTTSDTYMISMGWSNALKKVGSSVSLTPIEGGGTVKLMRGVVTNQLDIGFIGSPHMGNALNGELNFEKDPADLRQQYKKVRSLFGVLSGMAQYIARGDSGIKSLSDLREKKVAIGTPGGMAGLVTRKLLEAHGLSAEKSEYLPQYLGHGVAMDEMRSNLLDTAIVWGNAPHSAVFNFSRQIPVTCLSIDEKAFEEFKKTMPQGEYYSLKMFTPQQLKEAYGEKAVVQDRPSNAWTFQMMIIVRDDMPEDVAYEITKQFWENLDFIKETSSSLDIIDPKDALHALSVEIHPGAVKYYREKGWL